MRDLAGRPALADVVVGGEEHGSPGKDPQEGEEGVPQVKSPLHAEDDGVEHAEPLLAVEVAGGQRQEQEQGEGQQLVQAAVYKGSHNWAGKEQKKEKTRN